MSLFKKSPGLLDNYSDIGKKLRKAWNNRLVFPPSDLPECYLRGHLAVCFKGRLEVGPRFLRFHLIVLPEELPGAAPHFPLEASVDNDKLPMLVESIHFVDDKQRVYRRVRSKIWLERSNKLFCPFGKSLYFSVVSGKFVFARRAFIKNRELNSVGATRPFFFAGQLPGQVVEARTQVVGNLAGEDAEPQWNRASEMIVNGYIEKLTILIGDDSVLPLVEKGIDLPIEIEDALIGPFELLSDSF